MLGINTHTPLCIKQITYEDLLFSTGDSAQCLGLAYQGKESEKEQM